MLRTSIIILAMLFNVTSVAGQTSSREKPVMLRELNVLKSNPLAIMWSQIPFTGEIRVMYERAMRVDQSVVISASYIFISPLDFVQEGVKELEDSNGIDLRAGGYRVQLAWKYYFNTEHKPAPYGFYVGPHASFNSVKFFARRFPDDWVTVNFANVSVIFGYQLQTGGRFVADAHFGLGYKNNFAQFGSASTITNRELEINKGLKPSFAINIGAAF